MSEEDNTQGLQKNIPAIVKVLVAVAIALVVGLALVRLGGCKKAEQPGEPEEQTEAAPVELPSEFPPPLATQWPQLLVDVESVARNSEASIVAHWRYQYTSLDAREPFAWGADQPNLVALTRLRDATGREYPVAVSGTGIPLCSDVRANGVSAKIYGGHSLPAWAMFAVAKEAVPPIELVLYGVTGAAANGVKVPVLTADEQAARAFVARETSWPDVWIQLDEVVRTAPGAYRVKWRYVNRNLAKAFSWSRDQPDLPARTELFDFASGSYKKTSSASSMHGSNNAPTTIPAGGELPAEATFEGVSGDHFELIFHGSLPVFYDLTN